MSSFGSQNQLQLSLVPVGELLKAVMLLSNFNGFNSHSYPSKQRFMQKKKVLHPSLPFGRKKIPSDSFTFLTSCMVWVMVWVSLGFNALLVYLFVFFMLCFKFCLNKNVFWKIQKQCMFVYLCTLGWPLKQSS